MFERGSDARTPGGVAVRLRHVTKEYAQSRRENAGKGLLRAMWKPEKKIIRALDDVSFTVSQGEFVAYAGPNGAGKSTTMKLLSGMLLPASGTVEALGMRPDKQRVPLMRRMGVLFGNRTELWWDHPVSQSFLWKKTVWDIPDAVYKANFDFAVELLGLGDLLKTFARELSFGQRMRADLAMMLLHGPELILLDEPTLGLDVVAKRQMIDALKTINAQCGVTVLVTSHDMDDLEEMATRVILLSEGKLAYDGRFDGLRDMTGSPSRVAVTMKNGETPIFPEGALAEAKDGVFEYEVDLSRVSVREVLARLSALEGVADVEIRKAPIERVIAALFTAWKG